MAISQNSVSLFDDSYLGDVSTTKVAIVFTEWNDSIVNEQLKGAHEVLQRYNITQIEQVKVPGCFELPFACKKVHELYQPDVIIAFGAVIRGGTPHFEYVCKAVTEGITQLNLTLPAPVIFGVLTLNTEQEAWERLGGVHGHKGEEAALTAVKMARLAKM